MTSDNKLIARAMDLSALMGIIVGLTLGYLWFRESGCGTISLSALVGLLLGLSMGYFWFRRSRFSG